MENIWKDATTYSRNDKDRIPSVFEYQNGGLCITVVRGHRFNPENWVVHCHQLGIDTADLKLEVAKTTPEQAQEAAIEMVRTRLRRLYACLPKEIK